MPSGRSLPQINLGVQGGIQGGFSQGCCAERNEKRQSYPKKNKSKGLRFGKRGGQATVVGTHCSNSRRSGKFIYVRISPNLPQDSESLHSFDHSLRRTSSKISPTEQGLSPMLYVDLSFPCCLLSRI
ncbi:hypothetical protein TNCV_3907971 [Trichonephila clavipes]|nr:hypothetical protein TNCV_3907971 [Trichonephila clavipes]